jgi:hypothetical protein
MKTITLCGSTRFKEQFQTAEANLSLNGFTVYSCALWGHSGNPLTEEDKLVLDAVHMVKIANSDAIFVINPGGYVGESTRREIFFARGMGKKVYFLQPCQLSHSFRKEPRLDPLPSAFV